MSAGLCSLTKASNVSFPSVCTSEAEARAAAPTSPRAIFLKRPIVEAEKRIQLLCFGVRGGDRAREEMKKRRGGS
jgi:hypothetical protein